MTLNVPKIGRAYVPLDMTPDMMIAFLKACDPTRPAQAEAAVRQMLVAAETPLFAVGFRAACLAAPPVPPVEPDTEDMVDAALFRFWLRMIDFHPGAVARALAPCANADQHRAALMALARRLGVSLPGL